MLSSAVSLVHSVVWSGPLLIFLLGVGIALTFTLRGLQIRYLWYALKLAFLGPGAKSDNAEGDISHFQSLMTALASIIGIGNIVGVATAMAIGGAGALFWIWITALFGMATTYAESLLAVKYRIKDKRGQMAGGPMYYLANGMKSKWLAVLFAVGGCLAALTTGNMVQANSMSDALSYSFGIEGWWVGIVIASVIGVMILGGIKSIGKIASYLVPIMAIFYVVCGSIIIIYKISELPHALSLIMASAFTGQAAVGGFMGSTLMMAMRMGVARGLFSSEAGLGTTSIAAAAARTDTPGRQAMIAMTGTFLSTFLICTVTGLVLAVTGVLGEVGPDGKMLNGISLAIRSFSTVMPFGGKVVNIGGFLFAVSTILSWAYYGEKCVEYIFSERAIKPFRILFVAIIIVGCNLELNVVWNLADIANGIMAVPNLIAIVALYPVIRKETRYFLGLVAREKAEKKAGKKT
ncbi:MAG: sodium:alanine symporter family protein [Waddliaceae bacterium]|jgi:alanine or glycine:cation symporter, AGCS family|nr:sodium:alanine symporter family protein [Waddliaceae bacterium]MBT3579062.1 sodium:alanine symporter family protein [Waddliaceae bacterium]MBT4444772.1 sodium:alanine symporter family protein [Waddliaceae bacterium]MBT6928041.1 sodium:alanine symporter family protein [Waddliaceae bacterium]MBT7264425.1 sodium:alanine symporter family protein [Waddliaceae bacterium]